MLKDHMGLRPGTLWIIYLTAIGRIIKACFPDLSEYRNFTINLFNFTVEIDRTGHYMTR